MAWPRPMICGRRISPPSQAWKPHLASCKANSAFGEQKRMSQASASSKPPEMA